MRKRPSGVVSQPSSLEELVLSSGHWITARGPHAMSPKFPNHAKAGGVTC